MPELFETFMIICFGVSWPISLIKSITSRTAKGKSLFFILFVLIGYVFGISSKLIAWHNTGHITYVLFFYVLNFCMVLADVFLYMRNRRLDRIRDAVEV